LKIRARELKWDIHPPPCYNGWRPCNVPYFWGYDGTYAPVYKIIASSLNSTTEFVEGMRVKLVDGSGNTKYFIIVAIGSFFTSALLYLYGGTDYALTDANITRFEVSTDAYPVGFPANPLKWTVQYGRTVEAFYNDPVVNTWYNTSTHSPGGVLAGVSFGQLAIPLGLWRVSYQYSLYVQSEAAQTNLSVGATLSKANNTEDDPYFTTCIGGAGASGLLQTIGTVGREKIINQNYQEAPDIYYLNLRTTHADMDWIGVIATYHGYCLLQAECAYL
jgi:hypothetical protein